MSQYVYMWWLAVSYSPLHHRAGNLIMKVHLNLPTTKLSHFSIFHFFFSFLSFFLSAILWKWKFLKWIAHFNLDIQYVNLHSFFDKIYLKIVRQILDFMDIFDPNAFVFLTVHSKNSLRNIYGWVTKIIKYILGTWISHMKYKKKIEIYLFFYFFSYFWKIIFFFFPIFKGTYFNLRTRSS